MPQYVAFLRGINVGGHRVKMDRLKGLFADLGLNEVSTFIASGNVIFSTDSGAVDELRGLIESRLADELGYAVPTFIRSSTELAAIATLGNPDEGSSASSHYVIFLDVPLPEAVRSRLSELASAIDRFHFAETEVHWHIQGKLSESPLFGPGLDRATEGVRTTMRNMNTLRRIVAKTVRPLNGPPDG